MATLTIRNVPEELKQKIRMAAARRGVSMEQEARDRLAANIATGEKPTHKATVDEILALGQEADKPLDLKKLTDELWEEGTQ